MRTCARCGQPFTPQRVNKHQKYCSRVCIYPSLEDRFWPKVDRSAGPAKCWPWMAGKSTNGYGVFFLPVPGKPVLGRRITAHRMAWEITHGPIGDSSIDACHNCPDGDNPACCNPAHLFLGTRSENMQDCISKGRFNHSSRGLPGSAHPKAKLTEDKVREIRRRYAAGGVSQTSLAKDYGVNQSLVSSIVTRQSWKHVD